MELVKANNGDTPILMLDEVLAELDDERARRLLDAIGDEVQCLLTTTDPEDTHNVFPTGRAEFRIEQGKLTQKD